MVKASICFLVLFGFGFGFALFCLEGQDLLLIESSDPPKGEWILDEY